MILDCLQIKKGAEHTRVSCEVDGKYLYYEFPSEYAEYVTDSFDSFVLAMLPVALRLGEDMIIKGHMSEKLWFNIQNQIAPSTPLFVPNTKVRRVLPDRLSSERLDSQGAVGAGLSCGVDSLCSFEDHYFDESCPENFKITHAANFCVGAAGAWRKGQELFYKRLEGVKEYLSHTDLKFLPVTSNVADLHSLAGSKFTQTFGFRNMAVPMLFPKLFSKFYCASGYSYEQSWNTRKVDDLGVADPVLIPMMSTENVESILACAKYNRSEKVLRISKNPLTQKFIDVCISSEGSYAGKKRNCSKCDKCLRTLVTLDFYGCLQDFEESFDLEVYANHKDHYLKNLKKDKPFDQEILNLYRS